MAKTEKLPYLEAAKIIRGNDRFTQTESLENETFALLNAQEGNPITNSRYLIAQERANNFLKYVSFIEQRLSQPLSPLAQAAYKAQKLQEMDEDFANLPDADKLLDTIEIYMTALLEDPQITRDFIKRVKQQARFSTFFNTEKMREAEAKGDILETDVIIVGASLNALPIIKLLSPFLNIKVIANDLPGEPWYSRQLFLNSSSDGTREGSPLPLVGDATPIGGCNSDGPTLANLADNASKIVPCDSPEAPNRKYKAGPKVGAVIGTQLATAMKLERDFIQAEVLVEETDFDQNDDGLNTISLRTKNGQIFQYKAKKIIFVSGPGEEQVKLPDKASGQLCKTTLDNFRLDIRTIEQTLIRQQEKGLPLPRFDLAIPTLSDFTLICEYMRIWEEFYDRDPQLYPLRYILEKENNVAIIGDGDTQRILAELLNELRGPASAYIPEGITAQDSPQTTVYGIQAQTAEEYNQKTRRRYNGALDSGNIQPAPRANSVNFSPSETSWRIQDANGDSRLHKFTLFATGLNKTPLAEKLRNFTIEPIVDDEGIPVGTGDLESGIFIGGPASRLTASQLAPEIRNILQVLDVPENTVAAWVWNPLSYRLGLTVLREMAYVAYFNDLTDRKKVKQINLPGFSKIQQQAA